nr:unnamed protein product [Spirometra erinaceieuropaei]
MTSPTTYDGWPLRRSPIFQKVIGTGSFYTSLSPALGTAPPAVSSCYTHPPASHRLSNNVGSTKSVTREQMGPHTAPTAPPVRLPHPTDGLPPYQFDFRTTTPDAPIAQRLDPKLGDVDITSQLKPHTSGPHALRAANGTLITILGRITLGLTIDNTEVTYQFLVTSDSPWALVLGLDLLADYDCVIHTKSHRLSIPAHPDPSNHTPPQNLDLIYDAVVAAATLEPSDIDANLPPAETVGAENRNRLRKLLLSFPGLFTWSTDTIGRTRKVQHVINTGDAKPIWQPPRRIPVRFRAKVDKIIDELLKASIIQPSSSPWASPIALVPKKDGSLRLCIDYRRLNAVTVRDSFPMPRLDDTLDSLGGAAWFSTLDLISGYWQVEIDPKDHQKTAFIVPQGLFEFQTFPFGLCNAAATFQRSMYQVLRHVLPHKCLVHLYDIILFGPDVEQHNRILREVLEALRAAGLTLNPAKCTFLRPEVQFLGHKISPGRIAALPDRLQQIRTWPTPANQTQLRSFLGLASYYRRFIRNFANIAKPLHKLTEKGRDFRWSLECEEAFTSLRAALVSAPLLALPKVNPDAPPFILDTDASGFAIGAVLSQTDAQGVEHPICFASNTLTKSQRSYCTFRRELLAIITFIGQFKHLLIGRRFILRTDHKALQWLQSIKDPMDQLARWQEFLQDFDFDCQFRPGHSTATPMPSPACPIPRLLKRKSTQSRLTPS